MLTAVNKMQTSSLTAAYAEAPEIATSKKPIRYHHTVNKKFWEE
jgi:hypothetical protein